MFYCYLETSFCTFKWEPSFISKPLEIVHYYKFYNLVTYFGFIVLRKIDPAFEENSTYIPTWGQTEPNNQNHWAQDGF